MEYDLNDISFVERMLAELPSCIYLKDRECRYVFSTHYWTHLNAEGEDWTIRGKTDLDIRKDKDNARLAMEQDRKIIETGIGSTYTIKEHTESGAEYLEIIKRPVRDENGDVIGIIGLINDVTEKEELRMRWERSAHTDSLTGLSNRCHFDDVKDSFEPWQYPIAVVMADCDNLKLVNDSMGHAAGDTYLRSAAVVLRSSMTSDAMLFRVGGDEFIILMPNTTEKEAEACIESARQLAAQMKLGDMPLSMSYGLSMLASKCDLTERAVEAADRRMYQEKRLHHAAND
ncbi:MAG: GGDEF domain-containing protein [Coriobacteriaceae bacterium]|nr:GGDEF domain-containing protein [Coriobacteriaceae bacterium]MDD6769150.1 GGDEF domain-containing protein [Coriobacteriaceae bacterium]